MSIKSKKTRYSSRDRKKFRIRKRVVGSAERPRLTVFRSGRHMYAQAIIDVEGKTVVSASTAEKAVMARVSTVSAEGLANDSKSTKGALAAKTVGLVLAERLKEKAVTQVVFDRNGYIYHGRVKALADGAREGGLQF